MHPKSAMVLVLALAVGSPAHCFAKASPVVFHDRPFSACERQECLQIEKVWLRLSSRRQLHWARECGALIRPADRLSPWFFFDHAFARLRI